MLRSPDTDVFLQALYFQEEEITVPVIINRQATQKKWKFIDISATCEKVDDCIIRALLGMHAFSGCDSTSLFSGRSKKGFYDVLTRNTEFCEAMTQLGDNENVTPGLFKSCEAGLCEVYGYPPCRKVNQFRYEMLSKGLESHQIPPT